MTVISKVSPGGQTAGKAGLTRWNDRIERSFDARPTDGLVRPAEATARRHLPAELCAHAARSSTQPLGRVQDRPALEVPDLAGDVRARRLDSPPTEFTRLSPALQDLPTAQQNAGAAKGTPGLCPNAPAAAAAREKAAAAAKPESRSSIRACATRPPP